MIFSNLQQLIVLIPVALLSITFHEYAHGRVSKMFGDPTPERSGRLTLNPIKHLDIVGTLMIMIVGFGWAKPVPVNPGYYKNPKRDMAIVGLAGPLTNFTIAIIAGRIGVMFVSPLAATNGAASFAELFLEMLVMINVMLGCFNLLPIPPLDGSRVLAYFIPMRYMHIYGKLERYGILIVFALIFIFRAPLLQVFGPLERALFSLAGYPNLLG